MPLTHACPVAGDEATWSLADWNWDSHTFTAMPRHTTSTATAQCRAPKRQKVQTSGVLEALLGTPSCFCCFAQLNSCHTDLCAHCPSLSITRAIFMLSLPCSMPCCKPAWFWGRTMQLGGHTSIHKRRAGDSSRGASIQPGKQASSVRGTLLSGGGL